MLNLLDTMLCTIPYTVHVNYARVKSTEYGTGNHSTRRTNNMQNLKKEKGRQNEFQCYRFFLFTQNL